ncbi:hypothetical protein DPMN_124028 [Dreissena polymorpha]|uniref:Uncharacterized protein n=1 Tax=Dreissena polymorpha TaxID=45954 RepID=A0A9D4GVN0_DREPO|nr:hypothetical protein DPMN_124028 [Dreissena polymorpha]
MADYVELLKDKRTGNWFKLFIACFITKQGLEKFVDSGLKKFHEDIYTRVFKMKKIPEGTECHQCKPQKIFCKNPQPCEHGICDKVHEMVAREHALKTPSWSNTQCWMSSYWEVAKCFLPSSGYRENTGVKDTDFNGIVSLMIHCKHFQNSLSFYIADEKSVLSKARGIGRLVRHAAELAITDQDMDTHFNVLLKLLEDPKCLLQDPAAQTAARNIRLLHDDNLEFLSGDNGDMLRELTNQQRTIFKMR